MRAESGANGWVEARDACGGRALSLSEHGLSGRGAWGLGRTLNVDRAQVRLKKITPRKVMSNLGSVARHQPSNPRSGLACIIGP
mgnify:CR=1 FL=1